MTEPTRSTWAIVGQAIAIAVVGAAAVLSSLLAYLILLSRLGDPASDPHGYVLIFGSLLLVPTSAVGAVALPFVTGPHRTLRIAALWCALAWLVGALALVVFALNG